MMSPISPFVARTLMSIRSIAPMGTRSIGFQVNTDYENTAAKKTYAMKLMKPPAGKAKHDARVAARIADIQSKLANQEKIIADFKKTLPPKPKKEGVLRFIKKAAWEK